MRSDFLGLPANLPAPEDDGAAAHLEGLEMPAVVLPTTAGRQLDLRDAARGRAVLFFYPRTGRPDEPSPGPAWDLLPGARGCTPQSCAFGDLHGAFRRLGIDVFGVSTQQTAYQREFAERIHLPFELLSDAHLALVRALRLPTFEFPVPSGGPTTLVKRMAWLLESGRIARVWYPVFPPDRNAAEVLAWIEARAAA